MFVLKTKYDRFNHYVSDVSSLEDMIFGLSGDAVEARRLAKIAKRMKVTEVFMTNDIILVNEKDEVCNGL